MEYNKKRFQKTNDKKVLHKVKKQWVVLSVAMLAALGGGITFATHAAAHADENNGQNNGQGTAVKNHINQNLKLMQTRTPSNNQPSQSSASASSLIAPKNILKQAGALHNQILNNAATTSTTNGRQQSAGSQSRSATPASSSISTTVSSASVRPRMMLGGAPAAQPSHPTASDVDYYVPIRRVYENADGTPQNKYNAVSNAYVKNSDEVNVLLSGISGQSTSVNVSDGTPVYDMGYNSEGTTLNADPGYALSGINNSSVSSITANIASNGQWHWGNNLSDHSIPTFKYKAVAGKGKDINVRYINQNGYTVSAATNGHDGATAKSSEVNYSGASSYGDTINVLAGLSSANSSAYNNYYKYGFSDGDTNPSFSDYTFGNSEQTVTLPIHGASYSGSLLTVDTVVYNREGSKSTSSYKVNFQGKHYGDLVSVSPTTFAEGRNIEPTTSDYTVDPDNHGDPMVYLSETGPSWIELSDRESDTPTPIANNTITFNYTYGARRGYATPIHVTYRNQNNEPVGQGMIKPQDSDYGDQINIPDGTDITNPSHNSMFGNGVKLPQGYSLDYDKNNANGYDHYDINSDYNDTSFTDGKLGIVSDKKVGQDLTIYVIGNYQSTNNSSQNKLRATIKEDGNVLGTIPLNLHGFTGNSEIISASDFENEAKDRSFKGDSLSRGISDNDTLSPSDKPYKVTFNGDGTISVQQITGANYDSNTKQMNYTTANKTTLDPTSTNPRNPSDGIVFSFKKSNKQVAIQKIHVQYYYSDASDIPNHDTPRAKNGLIPLDQTNINVDTDNGLDLKSYMKNPPKGYQFVKVLGDSANSSNIKAMNPNSNDTKVNVNSNDASDTINIKVIPTAGSITFHYYNQNGQPVAPDPDNKISGEASGKDFTNQGYHYGNDPKVNGNTINNAHTEFGNTPTQFTNTKQGAANGDGYYSRYGTYFDVKNIPVPTGYHIDSTSNQNMKRYYRFGRNHQDVNVMVVGNQDDVSHEPSNASNPVTTPGDKGNSDGTNSTKRTDPDTIFVTVHEMDPRNNQIRSYTVPSYVTGNTGDNFHLYADNFTPEANKESTYHFAPYDSKKINDKGANGTGNDNYVQVNGLINSDGTVTAGEEVNGVFTPQQTVNGDKLNQNNHVDFYYQLNNDDKKLKPINVTYMNGSTAVGFKQITPNSNDYDGEQIPSVIKDTNATQKSSDTNQGNVTGDTTGDSVPSGYTLADSRDKYPATINDTQNQNIVIPVKRDTTHQNSVKYTVIDNFYEGSMGDRSHLVGTSSANNSSSAYNGQQITVSAAPTATYAGASFNGDSTENATTNLTVASEKATPNVISYNYYLNNAPTNPKSAGSQGTKVDGTAQPIYVQYFAGSNATDPTKSDDYLVGSDNELTGESGYTYSNVTNNVPVPAGYHLDGNQTTSHTISDQPYQMDLHLAKNASTDANFPLTVILTDKNGKPFSSYVNNVRIQNNQSNTFNSSKYNPNSTDFTSATSDNKGDTATDGGNFTVTNNDGELDRPSGTLIYKLQSTSDLKPIIVHYRDVDTGQPVGSSKTLNGDYAGQDMSDVTYSNGQTKGGNPTIPTKYQLLPNQNRNYQIGYNQQNVDLLVQQKKQPTSTNNGRVTVNVVEVNKNGSDVYLPKVATTNNTTISPDDYIPQNGVKKVADYHADPNSTAYYVDPADRTQVVPSGDNGSVTFLYDQGHKNDYSGSIVLKYFNQYGQQVGTTDVINGKGSASDKPYNRYGQTINVTSSSNAGDVAGSSTGEPVPSGYKLDPNDQNTQYTFNNKQQNVDLFVKGAEQQTTLKILLHKMNQNDPSGNAPDDVGALNVPVNSPSGSTLTFDPNNYTPTGYQTASDANNVLHAKINPDGTVTPNVLNFYYVQNDMVLAKPYIVRYVNQYGKKVGYSDAITNPNLMNKSIDLTNPADGGEPVPTGYALASDNYGDQSVNKYKLGNDHTITLKVVGQPATVSLTIYQVEQNSDNKSSDATHTYTKQITLNGQVGQSFDINASQYVPNGYLVDPKNTQKTVTITAPDTLSINEVNVNGQQDNQAVFYYDPDISQEAAPIHVDYIDNDSGDLITQGYINPSDVSNGKVGTAVNDVATQSAKGHNPGIPAGYQSASNASIDTIFMHDPQTVYVPVEPTQVNATINIHRNILDNQGNKVASDDVPETFTAGIGSDMTYSPYDFIPQNGYGSLYATNSDNDQTVHVTGDNNQYTITWNYKQSGSAADVKLGTINVHYVTASPNTANNSISPITINGHKYYQVDQESDHGFDGDTFNLTDYLNDIPSYNSNYYHLNTNGSPYNTKAVIGYNGINGTIITTAPDTYAFNTSSSSDTHPVYGDKTYAITDSNGNAKDTQDIYILVAPNNSNPNGSYPNNQGNDAGGDENPGGDSTNKGSNVNLNN